MYLWILKVTGLGKLCGQSYGVITVLEKVENFEKNQKIVQKHMFFNDFVSFVMRCGDHWSKWLRSRSHVVKVRTAWAAHI